MTQWAAGSVARSSLDGEPQVTLYWGVDGESPRAVRGYLLLALPGGKTHEYRDSVCVCCVLYVPTHSCVSERRAREINECFCGNQTY